MVQISGLRLSSRQLLQCVRYESGIAVLNNTAENLRRDLVNWIKKGDINNIERIENELRNEKPLIYSMLRDTLAAALESRPSKQTDILIAAICARLESLERWRQDGNETVQAINNGEIDADAIKPHIRFEQSAYEAFYSEQSDDRGEQALRLSASTGDQNFIRFGLGRNVNHSFRYSHAIGLVETLFGIIAATGSKQRIRWMDVGCGTGHFANAVDPTRYGIQDWDIVGCDMQVGKISIADRQKTRGRNFFASDAFEMLDNYRARGEIFDLISMFEFLEHLDDPLKFIKRLDTFKPKYILAASPLEQKLSQPRDARADRVHLWSFSRRSWEQMFGLAGFEVVYTSEVRIGTYIGGLDWLSVICGPLSELRQKRKSLNSKG